MTRFFPAPIVLAAALAVALLPGCNMNVRVDPEGFRCDVGGFCPAGYECRADVCRRVDGAGCNGDPCLAPPPATCADANTLRTFAGRCDAASATCVYEPMDTACAQGCQAGACVDPCAGVACTMPPAAACADANTLRTFAQTGTCSAGQCSYAPADVTCPNGCVNAVCQGVDLCAGKTCTTPPPPVCMGAVQRTFAAAGTCEAATGQCQYAATDTPCPGGCMGGACVAPSLTFTQVGPRVRFPISAIDVAPNSGGNSVVAVGEGGRMARWNGTAWAEVVTPTGADLRSVNFVTGTLAYVVGDNKTVLAYRPGMNAVAAATLPGGSNGATLVGVSGRAENDVFVADDSGTFWRLTGLGWTTGSLPAGNGPYRMTGVFLDESGRERIVGTCGSTNRSCVAYRFPPPGATPLWRIDTRTDGLGFGAIGGGFDVPGPSSGSEVFTGQSDNDLVSHSNVGTFTSLSPSPALTGGGIVGITAQSSSSRQVYVLTSSAGTQPGRLFRLTRSSVGGAITSTVALDTYLGEEVMSPTEATGVIVAEVNRPGRANNVFRRSVVVDEALDVGEDLAGASADSAGTLVLSSIYGDVATLAPGESTFDFRRPPVDLSISAVEARRGTGILLAGRDFGGSTGKVYRVLPASGFTELSSTPGTTWNALCRVSDTEGWVVGTGGAIASVTAGGVTSVTSPTVKDLLAVDCAPGLAVAAGADGAVVVFASGAWTLAPTLSTTRPLTGVGLAGRTAFVAGDGVFARLEAGAWAMLPTRTGLKGLVVRGLTEVYGSVLGGTRSQVHRFDGTQWSPSLLDVTGALGGGVQVGGRVVWGGSAGVVVEGR